MQKYCEIHLRASNSWSSLQINAFPLHGHYGGTSIYLFIYLLLKYLEIAAGPHKYLYPGMQRSVYVGALES